MLLKKIKLMDDIKLDFFHLEESSPSNPDIFQNAKYKPTLNNYSRFLITFDEANLISKGITDTALDYSFSVYKETENSNQITFVANLADGALSVNDYNVKNNTSYKYYIFKEDESSISEAVLSNEVKTCWWDWSLVDIAPSIEEKNVYYANSNQVWTFDLNLSSADTTQTMSTTIYDNLTRFPKVSTGRQNYAAGSITCLLGSIKKTSSGKIEYFEPASLLEEWNEFCNNGNIKLLKDRKGNSMLVSITETSSKIEDETQEQVTSITFNWVQVDTTDSFAIIGG